MYAEEHLPNLMFKISTELPFFLSIFTLLLGFGYAYLLYSKEDKISNIWLKRLLFIIRGVIVFFLSFLLLNPLIKSLHKDYEKPILVIAQDASSSIQDTNIYSHLSFLAKQLETDFDVFTYHFDEYVKEGITTENTGLQTNYSKLFDQIDSRFVNRNVTAHVFVTDGLYNVGENPLYKSNTQNIPIYPIALGDSIQQKDLLIKEVMYNEIAFLGNDFPIEISIESFNCKNENIELKLYDSRSLLHKQKIIINKNDFYFKLPLKVFAKQKGLQKYSLQLNILEGEKNEVNNKYEIYVDILDSKHNILILTEISHPDISALKSVLERNKYYNVKVQNLEDFSENIERYNLIVLYQIPSSNIKSINSVINSDIPLLYFVGANTDINHFNKLFKGLIIQKKNFLQEVFISQNKNFSLFTISKELSNFLLKVPPLYAFFGDYQLSSVAEVLLNQKIGKIITKKPILFFENSSGRKIGVFAAEGFWKWKLMEFSENKENTAFNELFSKISQYLLLQEDKSRFRLDYQHKINAKSSIIFKAEFYNEIYESVNNKDISLIIKDNEDKEYPFVFSRLNKTYYLNLGVLPVGEYSFLAKVEGTDYTKKGVFSVVPFQAELLQLKANHQFLHNLALHSGGKMFFPDQFEDVLNEISNSKRNKTIIHTKEKAKELINIQWIFFILLSLLCFEWFIRKYNGLN